METWKSHHHSVQLCVIGGGLAGLCCAIAAARHGTTVALVQDRPMLGGNCSSEIRMQVRGAHGKENKETGILSELELEAIYRNPTMNPNIWDSILYGKVKAEPNITLLLNTSCIDVKMDGNSIQAVRCWQLTTYSWHTIEAELFADCSGDSVLSVPSGAQWRIGREASSEFGESMGLDVADSKTMGMSILLQARQNTHPVPFTAPEWAYVYDDESFATIAYDEHHSSHRDHELATDGCNFWWIELGGHQQVLDDAEQIRDELLKTAYGVWDHLKNHGDHHAETWELEWIGFLPGKRESRRYVGPYILTQNDIQSNRAFDDMVGYGGWPLDDHNPMGFLNRGDVNEKSQFLPTPSPYAIPFRVLHSVNVANLFFAGRNISATHAALSSTRVMGTCAILGQAIGTAAAICCRDNLVPAALGAKHIAELQRTLVEDYCFLPGFKRPTPALTKLARHNLTAAQAAVLFDGFERISADGTPHSIALAPGQAIEFSFDKKATVRQLRIVFDPDYSRQSITPFVRIQKFAMRSHIGQDFQLLRMPAAMARRFTVEVDNGNGQYRPIHRSEANHRDLFTLPVNEEITRMRIVFESAWSADSISIFACDLS
jgi:hypothetical protein